MSLRDKIRNEDKRREARDLFGQFGVNSNPYPPSAQNTNNPHFRSAADEEVEARVIGFLHDHRSQVVVIQGTQGVGKTNLLNFWEKEIEEALGDAEGYYVIRYLADPEASFDGTIRRLFQELGLEHIHKLSIKLAQDDSPIEIARMPDMRVALHTLAAKPTENERLSQLFRDWLLGFRLLKAHREELGVQFRLDTVEAKTSALRDMVLVSSKAGILEGVFLLLDELEKQDGVLGPTAVVRYLSALRAIIDALPNHLFMMLAVTPDAMLRYSEALPAFRSRLQNQILLKPLESVADATALANFYLTEARRVAALERAGKKAGNKPLVSAAVIDELFGRLHREAERRGDTGVRQREFLHGMHNAAEVVIQAK